MTKVIVADDDETIRMLVRVLLQRAGFEVSEAKNGQEALALAEELQPAVLIVDSMMPVMDGMETITRLQANPAIKDIPTLMLSGRRGSEDIVSALREGADDYITKPFDRAELIERVRRLAATARPDMTDGARAVS